LIGVPLASSGALDWLGWHRGLVLCCPWLGWHLNKHLYVSPCDFNVNFWTLT
jgi:hypothetical protein